MLHLPNISKVLFYLPPKNPYEVDISTSCGADVTTMDCLVSVSHVLCLQEVAQVSLRIHKVLFCGTVFLCGVDPPVLKLHKDESGASEYISVVEAPSPPVQVSLLLSIV